MPRPGETQRSASKFIVFEQFEKMNTQSVRQALNEKELAWLENLQPIAPNNLVTVPAPLAALTSISETIFSQFYVNLGLIDYILSFTTVGSGWATNIATGVSTRFAAPGTFTNPDVTVWQSSVVLFNDIKAGYSFWDGSIFSRQGGVSPNISLTSPGSGYSSVPSVAITGGSGTGATAVATIGTPAVVAVNVITGGTQYGPAPGVVFAGGGGSGAAATAIIDPRGLTTITLTNTGLYQAAPPTGVSFSGGGGSGAAASFTTGAGPPGFFLTGITITSAGSNYTSAPSVTITGGNIGPGGHVATATCTVGDGRVLSITITAGGSGYTSAPAVSFTGGGSGSGATAGAVIGGSGVTSVVLTNPGTGYLASDVLTVTFTGGHTLLTINSGTYNAGTGAVSLTMSAPVTFGPGTVITVQSLTGTGAFASLNGTYTTTAGTTGTTVNYTGPIVAASTITGGSLFVGTNATATAHVSPFVPAGTTIAVFAGRVWLGGGRLLQYTGTAGYDDFNAANASGSLTISDADLVHAITALRNYNNYLFIMGDQSVKQIGAISLNAAGNVTLFTILTLSSDQGTIYPRSCGSFNRTFMFANSNGIYGVYGSSVVKLSDDMDGIFRLIDFSQQPQAALADIRNIHNITWLVRYIDPLDGTRSIMLTFTGKKWFVINQGNSVVSITTASTLASGKTMLYSSSGSDITQLLGDPTTPVPFKMQTALTHHGNAVQRKRTQRGGWAITGAAPGTITMSMDSDEAAQSSSQSTFAKFFAYLFANNPANVSGRYLGATITGTQANLTATNVTIEYQEANVGNQN